MQKAYCNMPTPRVYHAKKSGRNVHQFFAPAMGAFARERLELENGLRRALARQELRPALSSTEVDVRSGGHRQR